jgi:hypothetical protein
LVPCAPHLTTLHLRLDGADTSVPYLIKGKIKLNKLIIDSQQKSYTPRHIVTFLMRNIAAEVTGFEVNLPGIGNS